MTCDDRTYASTFLNTSENRLSKVRVKVSEKTDVPAKNDVPRMTASEVRMSRALRPTIPFKAIRNTT